MTKKYQEILASASEHLQKLPGHIFDVLTIAKPVSPAAAVNLSKVISKLSPLVGNLIEFNTVKLLNDQQEYHKLGTWYRQDPGFPDAIFISSEVIPAPGFEIKAWFPLATEITARFKDSQNRFTQDQTYICILAWLPDQLIFGRPKIIDVCIVSGQSVAKARDDHYHKPPDYFVLEPEDTTLRTQNLQQTNTNGYKWQDSPEKFEDAKSFVESWGKDGKIYKPSQDYQEIVRQLMNKYQYRLDTNFAKIDRICHPDIEKFKNKVLNSRMYGRKISEWVHILYDTPDAHISKTLSDCFGIKEENVEKILD